MAPAASISALHETIVQRYSFTFADAITQEWFGHSGFANFGYWDGAVTAAEASGALIDRLVAMIPPDGRHGRVLDVACGTGATTERLTRTFDASATIGINIGADQLERARLRVPAAAFQLMDAVDLQFDDDTFDVITCVEAAHHFDTRARFLSEAFRVLKPGGWLVLSDVLFRLGISRGRDWRHAVLSRLPGQPADDFVASNLVKNLDAYADLFSAAGFSVGRSEDAMAQTWREFYRRHRRYLLRLGLSDYRAAGTVWDRLRQFALWDSVIYAYPLTAAQKPR